MTAGAGLPLGAETGAAGESAPVVPDANRHVPKRFCGHSSKGCRRHLPQRLPA